MEKIYRDQKVSYWWSGKKRKIEKYVSKCMTCAQVNADHQQPYAELQQPEISEWKCDKMTMYFVTKLPNTSRGNDMVMVMMYQWTKSVRFVATKVSEKSENLEKLILC